MIEMLMIEIFIFFSFDYNLIKVIIICHQTSDSVADDIEMPILRMLQIEAFSVYSRQIIKNDHPAQTAF